jgi:type IV fimbrial biogenesis protein FimT
MLSDKCFANSAWRRASRGYNMIELITAMSIVAILVAIAAPSFRYVTNANRIASEGNGLLGDLQYARAEAIKEGQSVSVCVSSDAHNCTVGPAFWQNGWIVFSDPNGNGVVDAGETVLRVQAAFSGSDTFVATPNLSVLTFNREGFAAVANGTLLITLQTVPEVTSYTRCLSVGAGLMEIQHYNGDTPGGTCR